MTRHKLKRPASLARCRPRDLNKLATTAIDPTNTLKPADLQASFATDDRREDNLNYFAARPSITMRIRGPLPGELDCKFLRSAPHNPIVVVTVYRDPVTGWPVDRDRDVFLTTGGTA
jgi:hypothetical protein